MVETILVSYFKKGEGKKE